MYTYIYIYITMYVFMHIVIYETYLVYDDSYILQTVSTRYVYIYIYILMPNLPFGPRTP